MPLFFYVGGYSHLRSWEARTEAGESIWRFVWRRRHASRDSGARAARRLGRCRRSCSASSSTSTGSARRSMLVVSPLWFLAVYLMLIVLLPVFLWLHRRFDVDRAGLARRARRCRRHPPLPLRLRLARSGQHDLRVGAVHQLGFFYDRLVAATRRNDWALLWAGLFGLAGLVASHLLPGIDGRRARRAQQHGTADAVHRRARAVPGRRRRGRSARGSKLTLAATRLGEDQRR